MLTAALSRGRAAAEALMTDACSITRPGATELTFNNTTGAYTAPAAATPYAGKCRVKPQNLADRVVQAGEQAVTLWPYQISIPAAADADLDDEVTVTSSLDPSLIDRRFRVRSISRGTFVTARRLDCEEVSD